MNNFDLRSYLAENRLNQPGDIPDGTTFKDNDVVNLHNPEARPYSKEYFVKWVNNKDNDRFFVTNKLPYNKEDNFNHLGYTFKQFVSDFGISGLKKLTKGEFTKITKLSPSQKRAEREQYKDIYSKYSFDNRSREASPNVQDMPGL